jgi:glutathione S-transferase
MNTTIEYDQVLVEQIKQMLDILANKTSKKAKFSCGDHLTFADYCVATMYFCIQVKEPTIMPVFLDEYESVKPYIQALKDNFPEYEQL